VKAAKAQGAKIASRVIEASDADKYASKVEEMQDEIEEILKEEKDDKLMAQAEMEVRKGENIMTHHDEIQGRPRRTWFESEHDKKEAQKAGRAALNGQVESASKKKGGKLSNKDKKKLDDASERKEGRVWKKGKAERDGKGAVENFKKDKKKKKKIAGGGAKKFVGGKQMKGAKRK